MFCEDYKLHVWLLLGHPFLHPANLLSALHSFAGLASSKITEETKGNEVGPKLLSVTQSYHLAIVPNIAFPCSEPMGS